jgi:glycosyltransferase involved in cell wall biosynthesis
MKVLGITAHRAEEIAEPMAQMDAETFVLTIDPPAGLLAQVVETVRAVRTAMVEHDPDVVLLDAYETIGLVTVLLGLRYRTPVVCRLVGDRWREYSDEKIHRAKADRDYPALGRYYLSMAINRLLFRLADGFVVVSTELKSVVERRVGCPPERVHVVHVPLDPATMDGTTQEARRRLGIDERRVVLTVTNLKYEGKLRGVRQILDGIRPLLEERDDVAYVVAGGGRYHEALERDIEDSVGDSTAREHIYTPGFYDEIDDLYAAADVFAYVSYIDGYPNVILEAQASANPVVANAAHGIVEQIEAGETGVFVNPERPEEIEATVRALLDDDDRRDELGGAARTAVAERNHPEVIGADLEAALRSIRRHAR